MDYSLWTALIVTALGTYAMRLLPVVLMKKHLTKHNKLGSVDAIPQWLSILGPLMIAAMLGVSMIPKEANLISWLSVLFGCTVTYLAWLMFRSFGLPVIIGVISYGLVVVWF